MINESYQRTNSEYCDTEEINKSVRTPPRKFKNGEHDNNQVPIDENTNQYGLRSAILEGTRSKEAVQATVQFSSFSLGSEGPLSPLKQKFDDDLIKTQTNSVNNNTITKYIETHQKNNKLGYTDES